MIEQLISTLEAVGLHGLRWFWLPLLTWSVLVAAVALLSGCSVPGFGPGRTVFEGDVTVPAGEFHVVEFALDAERDVRFGIDGTEGPNLDVFFLPRDQLAAYRDGDPFEYRAASGLDVEEGWAADSAVPPGEYAVVYDNTDAGEARPDGRMVRGRASVHVQPTDDDTPQGA